MQRPCSTLPERNGAGKGGGITADEKRQTRSGRWKAADGKRQMESGRKNGNTTADKDNRDCPVLKKVYSD